MHVWSLFFFFFLATTSGLLIMTGESLCMSVLWAQWFLLRIWGRKGEKDGDKVCPLVFRLCLYRNGAHKAIAKRERDRDRTSGLHSFSFLVLILTVLAPLFCLSFPNLNLSPSHELKNFCHILERRFCFDFEPRSKWFFLLGLTFC